MRTLGMDTRHSVFVFARVCFLFPNLSPKGMTRAVVRGWTPHICRMVFSSPPSVPHIAAFSDWLYFLWGVTEPLARAKLPWHA